MRSKLILRSLLSLFLLQSITINAQQMQHEKRVYYIDESYSMKTNGIWDLVRDNLKNAIMNIEDQTTELVIIPFTDRDPSVFPLPVYFQLATEDGKEALCKQIDNLDCAKNIRRKTVYNVPLEDFYLHRQDPSKVTYMFFMTDGENEAEKSEFEQRLKNWSVQFKEKNIYGFFVMLHNKAQNTTVDMQTAQQPHLWKVETADININLIRCEQRGIFNVRNDQFVDIPIYGNTKGMNFDLTIDSNQFYRIQSYYISDHKIHIALEHKIPVANIPNTVDIGVRIKPKKKVDYTFLVTDNIHITCLNQKEYTLKVSIR